MCCTKEARGEILCLCINLVQFKWFIKCRILPHVKTEHRNRKLNAK